jgi:hypothetical protein
MTINNTIECCRVVFSLFIVELRIRSPVQARGAYLDTISVNLYLRLSDGDLINGCQFRLGASGTNQLVPATTFFLVGVTSRAGMYTMS